MSINSRSRCDKFDVWQRRPGIPLVHFATDNPLSFYAEDILENEAIFRQHRVWTDVGARFSAGDTSDGLYKAFVKSHVEVYTESILTHSKDLFYTCLAQLFVPFTLNDHHYKHNDVVSLYLLGPIVPKLRLRITLNTLLVHCIRRPDYWLLQYSCSGNENMYHGQWSVFGRLVGSAVNSLE